MHFLMIKSGILKKVLRAIIVDNPNNFIFHMLCDIQNDLETTNNFLTFQANYNDYFYTSFSIDISNLVFLDTLEFQPIILNYEQCTKLIYLCDMFDSDISIGFDLRDDEIEIVVSHSNIKLIFPIDKEIDHNPIIPPEHNHNICYIPLDTLTLYNVVKLVSSPKFYTPIKIDQEKSRIVFGDLIQSIIQLRKGELNLSNSIIDINPDSIISFLKNLTDLKINKVEIKVDKSIAFIIYTKTELGEIFYYSTHELNNE